MNSENTNNGSYLTLINLVDAAVAAKQLLDLLRPLPLDEKAKIFNLIDFVGQIQQKQK